MIQEIDLSNNVLGKDDALLYAHPNVVTAGESLGKLLRGSCNGALQTLKVQWNMIKGIGAMDLCDSLKMTSSLMYLDLSYNSLGMDGGTVLGAALIENKTLKELYIASNNIGPEACFTICVVSIRLFI